MFHRTCMLVCSTQHIRCGVIARSCLKGNSRAPLMRIWHLRHTFLIGFTRIGDGANQVFRDQVQKYVFRHRYSVA